MNRRITTAVIFAAAMLLVAACSGGSDNTPSGADSNTFDFWSFTGINQKADVERYT